MSNYVINTIEEVDSLIDKTAAIFTDSHNASNSEVTVCIG
jgi:hypothetical protein